MVVHDEVTAGSPVDIVSQFHTGPDVTEIVLSESGTVALLQAKNGTLKATILSPPGAVWQNITANPRTSTTDWYFSQLESMKKNKDRTTLRSRENENLGIVNLIVRPPLVDGKLPSGDFTITVSFALDDNETHKAYKLTPLDKWATL